MALLESEQNLGRVEKENAKTFVPILQLNGIHKSFSFATNIGGKKKSNRTETTHTVLGGVELAINEGEFVTIVGSSGCGKSTLLNIIAGLDKPDSGTILVKGSDNLLSTKRIMIFQEGALFPWLTVQENVEFGLKIAKIPPQQRKNVADKYITLVGLAKFSDSYVYQLSGGMKQRVAIARALALEPEILLMDEPFAALDVQTRDLLHEELVGIHKTTRKTILFVTHNINEAILLGDRVIVLSTSLKNIKKEFAIDLPRPRDSESPELYEIKRQILNEFEGDLQNAKKR